MALDYSIAGPLTRLDAVPAAVLTPIADDPVGICTPMQALVVHPSDPATRDLPHARLIEDQLRPASDIISRLLALHPAPLTFAREPHNRVVGTCRHFALLACALLRYRGIPARVRCGFATYFQPDLAVDHWILEFRLSPSARWIRLDPEVLGKGVVSNPADLRRDQFISGSEAWRAFRRGDVDGDQFGVYGTSNWGAAEIRGNVVKDFAALNKVEVLPWDEWGRMTDAYDGKTDDDYDALLDTVASVVAADDEGAITDLYNHPDLHVPDELTR